MTKKYGPIIAHQGEPECPCDPKATGRVWYENGEIALGEMGARGWRHIVCYQLEVEPVWETVEYHAVVSSGLDGRVTISTSGLDGVGESVLVKAKATFVDGKIVSGSWKVVE